MTKGLFPQEEYLTRWQRARDHMREAGLDALVVTERSNYVYFTGHQSLQFGNKMRPMLFVLPMTGNPFVVVYGFEEAEIRATTWLEDVYSYVDVPFPPDLLVSALKERGYEKGRIGWEFGDNQRLWLHVNAVEAAAAQMPDAEFVDASLVYTEVRMLKSALEVERIQRACQISEDAYELMLKRVRPGMTIAESKDVALRALVEAGSDPATPGFALVDPMGKGDSYVYKQGDYFLCDFGGSYGGYKADMARLATFGEPSAQQRNDHEQIVGIQREVLQAMTPGRRIADLARQFNDLVTSIGYPPLAGSKRIGHGLGLDLQEPPSINLVEARHLKEGMVLTPEPRFVSENEFVIVEETVVIGPEGATLLSHGFETLREIEA